MGTVTEISLVWNKLQTGVIDKRPLVLLGECWRQVVDCWEENLAVSKADVSFVNFADTADEACQIIINKSKDVKI
jgi:predicted Rossmann-fold nucleotide-binding protein